MNPTIEVSLLYFCLISNILTVDNCEIHPSFTMVSMPLFCPLKVFSDVMVVSACAQFPDGEQLDLHFCCFHRVIIHTERENHTKLVSSP